MSKDAIYNQLISNFDGFTSEESQYAVDNLNVDWKENALKTAQNYANNLNMSKDAIYNQLISNFDGFTPEDAQYAIDNLK